MCFQALGDDSPPIDTLWKMPQFLQGKSMFSILRKINTEHGLCKQVQSLYWKITVVSTKKNNSDDGPFKQVQPLYC